MSREGELTKNTVILTFGKICTQFISFMLLPLYTVLLLPSEYGVVDLINTYASLLVPLFNWQFENGLFRFMLDVRNNEPEQKKIFSTVMTTNFVQVAIYLCFYLLVSPFLQLEYKQFLAIDVVVNIILNTMLQFPRGLGKNVLYAVGSCISASLTVVLNVIFIAVMRLGGYGLFFSSILAKTVTIGYLVFATKAWNFFSFSEVDRECFKSISKYSLPLVPNQLTWWVVGASDRTIIAQFLGVAANGFYSIAHKFSTIYITFYNLFNMSWTESVSLHFNDSDRDSYLSGVINSMFNLFGCVCLMIIAVMPLAFPYIIDAKYEQSYYQIPILLLAVLFQVVVGLYSVIYVALKKSVEIAKTSFYAAIINACFNILTVKYIGLYAASISSLLAYMSMALYRYFHVKRYVDIKLHRKNVILLAFFLTATVFAYYSRNIWLQGGTFAVAGIYSVMVNYGLLQSFVITLKRKIRERR